MLQSQQAENRGDSGNDEQYQPGENLEQGSEDAHRKILYTKYFSM